MKISRLISRKGYNSPNNIGAWWILSTLIFSFSCIDGINLEGVEGGGQLVIQGQVIKSRPSSVRIRISRSADFVIRGLPTAVEGAVVILIDQEGNQLSVPELVPGIYQKEIESDNPQISIDTGENYQISVTTSEGSQYQSFTDRLNPVPIADSVSIKMIEREELDLDNDIVTKQYIQFFAHTPLETIGVQDKARIRWSFESVYRVDETGVAVPPPGPVSCYVTSGINLGKVVTFNGNESNSNRLDGFFLTEDEIGTKFGIGYLLRINQHSLSNGAYEYWKKVSQSVSLSGGLFEATPGVIIGNMYNINDPNEEVFGYFYASEEYKLTRFVTPDEAGNPKAFCSTDLFSGGPLCADCETIPESTGIKPEDWEQ
jgi:hypothetical protein